MEKTLKFSAFKEKIIKTNELLHLHLEKNKEVEKIKKCYQILKTKLEQCENEKEKLKLKNESLSYSLQLIEKNHGSLKEEYNELKLQFTKLEDESNKIINNLQVNYQMTNQELKEYKEKLEQIKEDNLHVVNNKARNKKIELLSEKEKLQNAKNKLQQENHVLKKQLENESNKIINYQALNQELKDCKEKLKHMKENNSNVENNGIMSQKFCKLLLEKEELQNEKSKLQLENYELKKQLQDLDHLQVDHTHLKEVEEELSIKEKEISNLKDKLAKCEENQNKEIERLLTELKTANIAKKKLEAKNDKLRNENSSLKIENFVLQDNQQIAPEQKLEETNKQLIGENDKSMEIINENQLELNASKHKIMNCDVTPTNEQIAEIMQEVSYPMCLSPLGSIEEECIQDNSDMLTPLKIDVPHIRVSSPLIMGKRISSPSGDFTVSNYHDPIKFSKSRIIRKKRKNNRKKSKKVDLLGVLIALKKANINFSISNEKITSTQRINPSQFVIPQPIQTEPQSVTFTEKKYLNTFTNKLSCSLACCKSYHMLLRGGENESSELLGFFDVKNENSSEQIENCQISWPKTVPYHRSTKKRKKIERKDKQMSDVNFEDHSNDLFEPILHDSDKTEEICLRNEQPQKISNLRLQNKRKSPVINNRQIKKKIQKTSNFLPSECQDNDVPVSNKKRIAHTIKQKSVSCDEDPVEYQVEKEITESVDIGSKIAEVNEQKTSFKRPLCRRRRSLRLMSLQTSSTEELPEIVNTDVVQNQQSAEPTEPKETSDVRELSEIPKTSLSCPSPPVTEAQESPQVTELSEIPETVDTLESCPQSPPTETQESYTVTAPKLIPLERVKKNNKKLRIGTIKNLLQQLINYSMEEEALNEIVARFTNQNPKRIARAILRKISSDYHETPDNKYSSCGAPTMTQTQRIMLGFMSKLEKTNVVGVFNSYLELAERKLLNCRLLQDLAPITRLYLAICKLQNNIHRMRKLCCEVFYFCGDFAVPFLFIVLCSWPEILPHEADSKDMPLARVLVQIIYMKNCSESGYNLKPLRDLLISFYGYPSDRWNSDELFEELFRRYLRNPVKSSDFALLLLCKNHPEKWVHDKIEKHLKPLVDQIPKENFKAAVIIFIGNLYNRFSSESDVNYLVGVREWLTSLVNETTPDVVKQSVNLCLHRLKNK